LTPNRKPRTELARRGLAFTADALFYGISKGDAQAVTFFLDAGMKPIHSA
jgi:hypothetical protein